jgi:hypothetical protein
MQCSKGVYVQRGITNRYINKPTWNPEKCAYGGVETVVLRMIHTMIRPPDEEGTIYHISRIKEGKIISCLPVSARMLFEDTRSLY